MQVKLTLRDIDVSKDVQTRVEERVSRLTKYFQKLQELRVVLSIHDKQARTELIADIEHGPDLVASHTAEDFLTSTERACEKMTHQLTKLKDKLSDHTKQEPLKKLA